MIPEDYTLHSAVDDTRRLCTFESAIDDTHSVLSECNNNNNNKEDF